MQSDSFLFKNLSQYNRSTGALMLTDGGGSQGVSAASQGNGVTPNQLVPTGTPGTYMNIQTKQIVQGTFNLSQLPHQGQTPAQLVHQDGTPSFLNNSQHFKNGISPGGNSTGQTPGIYQNESAMLSIGRDGLTPNMTPGGNTPGMSPGIAISGGIYGETPAMEDKYAKPPVGIVVQPSRANMWEGVDDKELELMIDGKIPEAVITANNNVKQIDPRGLTHMKIKMERLMKEKKFNEIKMTMEGMEKEAEVFFDLLFHGYCLFFFGFGFI